MTSPIIHANVHFADAPTIGPFCLVGEPRRGDAPGDRATHFGTDAILRSHSVIYAGNRIGDRFQTGHAALVREENQIGNDVSLGSHAMVEHHVRIGDGARIHSNVFIPEFSVLEAQAWLGPNVTLTNARYPRSRGVKDQLVGPTIKKGAKVGAGSVILPSVVIGEYALVGAGSVVTRDVGDGEVVVGNPGRRIKRLEEIPEYGHAR